jgi:hypothetical protein
MKLGSDTIFEAFCNAEFFYSLQRNIYQKRTQKDSCKIFFQEKKECHLQTVFYCILLVIVACTAVDKYHRCPTYIDSCQLKRVPTSSDYG